MAPARAHPFDYLTGRLTDLPRPRPITAPGQGGKFTPEGAVLPFPGNTIIFNVDPASDAHAAMVEMQAALKAGPSARSFAFLPPSSFHMTLFQGVSGLTPDPAAWPEGVPLGIGRDAITEVFLARLQGGDLPGEHRVRATDLYTGHSLTMTGLNAQYEARLRSTRRTLRDTMQLTPPGFDDYVFHITLAYLLEWLPDDEARAVIALSDALFAKYGPRMQDISFGPPVFCNFEDITYFEPLLLLGDKNRSHPV